MDLLEISGSLWAKIIEHIYFVYQHWVYTLMVVLWESNTALQRDIVEVIQALDSKFLPAFQCKLLIMHEMFVRDDWDIRKSRQMQKELATHFWEAYLFG